MWRGKHASVPCMDTPILSPPLRDWAEAQVAAGRAASVEALAAEALATVKAQQEGIAARLAAARADADKEGWIEGEIALIELRAWITEDEAEGVAYP